MEVAGEVGRVQNNVENFEPYIQFTKYVSEGDWDKAKECLKLKQLDLHSAVRAIDPRDEFGDTAIHVAARSGYVHIVKELMLLLTREDLKMKNAQGSTALHLAALNGRLETVEQLLILMGEEIDNDGDTALHCAVYKEKVDVVKELVMYMRPKHLKIKNNDGYTALHLAVKKRNELMVKDLGAAMGEVRGPDGDTALHVATKMGAAGIVKELVMLMTAEGLAIKNNEGYTALHLAMNNGNVPIVKVFMTKDKERDFSSYIQFTDYVIKGEWDNAKECLAKLEDINPCDAITVVDPRDGRGDTALHVAAKEGHVQIVKELISLLKVRQESLELKTVEDIAACGSGINLGVSEEVVTEKAKYLVEQYEKLLISILEIQNTNGSTPLQAAAKKGNGDIVKELVPLMGKEGLELQDSEGHTALLSAVGSGYIDIVKILLPMMRQEGLELKTVKEGYNALHLAIMNDHMDIAKEVMPLMRTEALEEKDGAGYTALGCALDVRKDEDVMEIAKYMAKNNNKVFGIPVPSSNWIPVIRSLDKSKWDLCRSLYPLTPLEYLMPMHGHHGAHLICDWLRAKEFDLALDLLRRYPKLCISEGASGYFPIMDLAGNQAEFLSGTELGVWQKLIYNRLRIEHVDLNTLDTYITVSKEEANQDNQMNLIRSVTTLYRALVCSLLKLLGVNKLRKMKWMHTRSVDALRCISEMLKNENLTSKELDIVKASLFKAVEHGHVEFVTYICEASPSFANLDQEYKNIFHFAVECRQHKVYSLLYRLDKEDQNYFGERVTKYPENMLHLAGNLSPLSRFNRIRGAALQMQRELQWFEEVEEIVPSRNHELLNSDGKTPRELFTTNHEKLKEDAEQSMKGTATSCTVVGALIVTIMFAAAFTVPGGTNNSTGAPMFLAKKLFLVFIISDTLSLVSSTTSVILFLGILTSRYAEDDFLKILPVKMMIGLLTLFISIATMMISFCSALIIMLKEDYSWAIIPSIFAASIPVVSFIWLQVPLLIEIFWSTYGPGIFDKKGLKGEPWIKVIKS
ncbi:uncharacterized protein LOC126795853 [Argentina anserina]|uniref:uncharacterized protein LOC126795853 n=1 Tax=Argentina anserina TaxID=57926 RepID=UPI0021764E17|nr:uncharacterized protein LOC126795853 [Potentilla anserina]